MEIVKFPNRCLFQKASDVTVFGPELLVLLESMWKTMKATKGIGLSANQVSLPYNMFVMDGPEHGRLFVINPTVVNMSKIPSGLQEGCLSAPGELLFVPSRKKWIVIRFQDETGAFHKKLFEGIHSVCVQHELEHLSGKSFIENAQLSRQIRRRLASKYGIKK